MIATPLSVLLLRCLVAAAFGGGCGVLLPLFRPALSLMFSFLRLPVEALLPDGKKRTEHPEIPAKIRNPEPAGTQKPSSATPPEENAQKMQKTPMKKEGKTSLPENEESKLEDKLPRFIYEFFVSLAVFAIFFLLNYSMLDGEFRFYFFAFFFGAFFLVLRSVGGRLAALILRLFLRIYGVLSAVLRFLLTPLRVPLLLLVSRVLLPLYGKAAYRMRVMCAGRISGREERRLRLFFENFMVSEKTEEPEILRNSEGFSGES